MAITNVWWNENGGYDIHLLPNATSRTLNDLLAIQYTDAAGNSHRDFANATPANIVTVLTPLFDGAPSAHGATVNTATGAVTAAAAYPNPRLKNFLIRAEVTEGGLGGGGLFSVTPKIRVHLHAGLTTFWLSPISLTVHQGSNGQRFSVIAQFQEGAGGDTVGDITTLPGITWASDNAAVTVDPATGELTATAAGGSANITATLPAAFGGSSYTAHVNTVAPWSTPAAATLVSGPGRASIADVPNVLFLPEGFGAGEEPRFQDMINQLLRFLRTARSTRPYDLIFRKINFWRTWIPSPDKGTSVEYEIYPIQRGTRTFGNTVPIPQAPDPAAPAAQAWTLQELVHEVGLPIPADAGVAYATKFAEWGTLFGAARVTAAKITDPAVHADSIYTDWLGLSDRRLVIERDSALGLANGQRPNVDGNVGSPDRSISWNPLRTTRAHLDTFLSALMDGPGGPTIGDVWGAAAVPGTRAGKDRFLVVALCAGSRMGGAETRAPEELVACELRDDIEPEITSAGRFFNSVPFTIPAHPAADAKATIAHEVAHALGLNDEYGDGATLPASQIAGLASIGNAQDQASMQDAVAAPAGDHLSGSKIRWAWPRIAKAGVLDANPLGLTGSSFRFHLEPGHAAPFRTGDIVQLRTRPLASAPPASDEYEITAIAGDEMDVNVPAGKTLNPGNYPAGSIVFAAVTDTHGTILPLVAPIIRDHITHTGLPLNADPARLPHVCSHDSWVIQSALNLPAGLPPGRPRYTAWIAGAYEGGSLYYCGVYHPTGACLMRADLVPGTSTLYSFCPICRYIMVDALDPTQHGVIDADYAARYPQP